MGNSVINVRVSSLVGANTLLRGNEFRRVVSSRRRSSLVRLFANRQDKVQRILGYRVQSLEKG